MLLATCEEHLNKEDVGERIGCFMFITMAKTHLQKQVLFTDHTSW